MRTYRSPRPRRSPVRARVIAAALLALANATASWCADCTPSFRYKDGWLGGDAAYSVPLDSRRSLWLFGDTFVGTPTETTRANAKMVANSIAISTCRDGTFDLRYYIRESRSGAARAFFDSETMAYRMWPLDGFLARGQIYVALVQVASRPGGGPLDFEMIGVKLARIANRDDDPGQWRIDYTPLASGKIAFPGVATVVEEPWVYLFAVLADAAHPKHPMILTRIALDRLDRPAESIEYLAKNGTWKHGLDWTDARIVIDEGHTEMSVRYHSDLGKWVAIQQRPGLRTGAAVRMADHLEGPWSSFLHSFAIPEPVPDHDSQTFCYAAKEHSEFARSGGDLMITYVCSSLDLGKLDSSLSLYHPVALRRLLTTR